MSTHGAGATTTTMPGRRTQWRVVRPLPTTRHRMSAPTFKCAATSLANIDSELLDGVRLSWRHVWLDSSYNRHDRCSEWRATISKSSRRWLRSPPARWSRSRRRVNAVGAPHMADSPLLTTTRARTRPWTLTTLRFFGFGERPVGDAHLLRESRTVAVCELG